MIYNLVSYDGFHKFTNSAHQANWAIISRQRFIPFLNTGITMPNFQSWELSMEEVTDQKEHSQANLIFSFFRENISEAAVSFSFIPSLADIAS